MKLNNEITVFELSSNVISLWKDNDKSKIPELLKELERSDELVTFLCRYQKERWVAESINEIEMTDNENELFIYYNINFYSGCRFR